MKKRLAWQVRIAGIDFAGDTLIGWFTDRVDAVLAQNLFGGKIERVRVTVA